MCVSTVNKHSLRVHNHTQYKKKQVYSVSADLRKRESESGVSSFSTAYQHILGYLMPFVGVELRA